MSNVADRVDHHPVYVCFIIALWGLTATMVLVGVPVAALNELRMAPLEQFILASILFVATTLALLGLSLGTRRLRPDADIRRCYRFGGVGNIMLAFAVWSYTVIIGRAAIHQIGAPSEWVYAAGQAFYPALLGLGFALLGRRMFALIARTERNMPIILRERGAP